MKVSSMHAYIYFNRIKKNYRIFICEKDLDEQIKRAAFRKGGFPISILKKIKKEMIEDKLIKKINKFTYEILNNKPYQKVAESIEIIE